MKTLKKSWLLLLAPFLIWAFTQEENNGYKIGETVKSFTLKNTIDDKMVSLDDYKDKEGVIVIFTCNHCPYAKAYEDRIIALAKAHASDFPVVAISSNDQDSYPEDGPEAMKKQAKEKSYPFPYLFDETQEQAKLFGATKTPHVYLLKREGKKFNVAYIGAIDDNYQDASKVKKHYLEDAIKALKSNQKPSPAETKAIGCSIKWKKQ